MSKSSRVAAAVAAGYVLGRFKKLRMAVMVGSAMANENVRQTVLGAFKQGTGGLGTSSVGSTLTQKAGSKLLDAGKAAAVAAAASRVDSLSDRLASRRASLSGEDQDTAQDDESESEDADEELEDEYEEPAEEEAEPADEDEEFEDEYEEPAEEDEEPADEEDEAEDVARSSRRGRSASPGRRSGS